MKKKFFFVEVVMLACCIALAGLIVSLVDEFGLRIEVCCSNKVTRISCAAFSEKLDSSVMIDEIILSDPKKVYKYVII